MNQPLAKVDSAQKLTIVDCDIHPTQRNPADLHPFLEKKWVEHMQSFGPHFRQALVGQLPYPRMTANGMRVDTRPADGPAGSSLKMLQDQHLNPNGIQTGLLIALSRGGMEERNPDFAAALSHASNEWQLAHFVDPEPRLRAGIVVAQDNPGAAAKEIEKRAGDRRFAQIIMSSRAHDVPGSRTYWPIFAAAEANGIPIGLHPAGYSSGNPSTGSGWPSFYFHEHYTFLPAAEGLVTSLIFEGVFAAFPKLKVAIIEGGFSWAPALGWRMDKAWETFRKEVPHVDRPPSEIMREHFRWATQPIEEPENPRDLKDIIDWIGWDRLLYSSDYPHWDYDDPKHVFRFRLDDDQRAAIFGGNATAFYGLA